MLQKLTLSFTCLLLCIILNNIQAQVAFITGTELICDGECGEYTYTDVLGNQPAEVTWQLSNGNIFNGNPIEICFSPLGDFTLTVFANGGNSDASFDFFVTNETGVELSSTASECPEAESICETICAGNSVTYSVDQDAGSVTWEVEGSDDFTIIGNEINVNWDTPGEGMVKVSSEDNASQAFVVNCGHYGLFPSQTASAGYLYIEGPFPDGYQVSLNDPNGIISEFNATLGLNLIPSSEIGVYLTSVTTPDGQQTLTCDYIIESASGSTCDSGGYPVEINSPSFCGACDGSIFLNTQSATGGVSVVWSNGMVGNSITGLCADEYMAILTDQEGCSIGRNFNLIDNCDGSVCSISDSICVQILEPILAEFSSFPTPEMNVTTICEGQSVLFQNQSTGGETFIWDFGDFNTSVETNPEHTYAVPGTYNVSLIARNECFCTDTTSLIVNVLDADVPEIDCIGTICEGELVTYSTSADCSTFIWEISSNGTILSGGGTNDDFVEVEWGSGPLGTISLAVSGCSGSTCTLPNVESIPIISDDAQIEGPISVCDGSKVIYSLPKYDGTDYAWTVSEFGTIVDGQSTHRITVEWNGTPPNNAQFVSVVYENCYLECGGNDEIAVSLVPEFYALGVPLVCEGTSENFVGKNADNNGSASLNWQLYAPNGALAFSSPSPTTSLSIPFENGAGVYRLVTTAGVASDWCTDSYELSIEVVEQPTAPNGITGENNICVGNPYTYLANSFLPNAEFVWEIIDGAETTIRSGNPINITWSNSGSYQVSVAQIDTEGLNCQSEFVTQIMSPITELSIIGNPDVCLEESSIYTATNYEGVFYDWIITPSDAGVIAEGEGTNQVDIFWTDIGNATLTLSLCGQTATTNINIREKPIPAVIAPANLCVDETATVSLTETYAEYTWRDEFGSFISSAANPSLGVGFYEVIVIDNFGCSENLTFQINPYPTPEISISTPQFTRVCLAAGGSFPQLFAENTTSGYTFNWYRNNIAIGNNNATFQTTSEGVYFVEVTDNNGCVNSSNSISVVEDCSSGEDFPNDVPECDVSFEIIPSPFCNTFTFASNAPNQIGIDNWYFDDGNSSTEMMPTHTYENAGFYKVVLLRMVSGGLCGVIEIVTVPVVADFSTQPVCAGTAMTFIDQSTFIPGESISNYSWDFGDPSSPNNTSSLAQPTHTYSASGTYTVTQTITAANGCISVKTQEVEVIADPNVVFAPPAVNCSATALAFNANVPANVTDVVWDFGDPSSGASNSSTSFNPYHKFSAPGVYNVTLTGTSVYGCSESFSQSITIEPNALNGSITASPTTQFCVGESAVLTAPTGGVQWLWSTSENSENITVSTSGVYSVTVVDAAGCAYGSAGIAVNVLPLPTGDIYAVEYDEYGSPISYNFTSHEVCEGEDVFLEIEENSSHSYSWSTGSNGSMEEFSEDKENQLIAGTYDIEVEITNENTGCTSISVFEVTVQELPQNVQIISDTGTPICGNTNAVFSVFNPNPAYTYVWNTDEIGTSIVIIAGGEYWVTAFNEFGCEAESNRIEVENAPDINKIPDGCHTRCAPDTICLPPLQNVASYQWFFNGVAMAAPNGTQANVVAEESGEYYVVMEDVFGCTSISDVLNLDLFIGTGTFIGEVYFDTNENGIIDAGDELLPNININLLNANGEIQNVGTTNGAGTYGFPDILSTDYILELDTLSLPPETRVLVYQSEEDLTGCDNVETINWLVLPLCTTINESLVLTSCEGNSVIYEGEELNIGESIDFTFQTAIGCDSILTVSLEDASSVVTPQVYTACPGEIPVFNGIEINPGQTEIITFSNQAGCDSIVEISVIASPIPEYSALTTESCWSTADGQIIISPPTTGNLPYEYAINGGVYQSELIFENLTGNVYTVNARDANGCVFDLLVEVPIVPGIEVSVDNQFIPCGETESQPDISVSGGRGDLTYLWNTGETNLDPIFDEPGIYTLSVSDECGTKSTEMEVAYESDTRLDLIYFPNAFSPNDDGKNDEFKGYLAEHVEIISYNLMIFDRWGNQLSEIIDIDEGWNGEFRGKGMDTAVLVYVLEAEVLTCGEERRIEMAGDVSLFR